MPVDSNPLCKPCWYLPFFVTKQAKSRVVFDGAATYKGVSLNDAVYPGENLLNGLVDVLTRFRLGKFACMADVSKCFFQVSTRRQMLSAIAGQFDPLGICGPWFLKRKLIFQRVT